MNANQESSTLFPFNEEERVALKAKEERRIERRRKATREYMRRRRAEDPSYMNKYRRSRHTSDTAKYLKARKIDLDGMEAHHWNYGDTRSVLILSKSQHRRLHRELRYDARTTCFIWRGVLLDSKIKHVKAAQEILGIERIKCYPEDYGREQERSLEEGDNKIGEGSV